MNATILFADVSGSTKLIEKAGYALGLKTIAHCVQRLKKAAEVAGGQVVKTRGDEVMVLFDTPDAAAKAAATMHATIDALAPVGDTKLGVHVGFHSGPVVQHEHDLVGDTVKLAAKLVEEAQKGQTLTSQQTAAQLSPTLQPFSRELRSLPLAGTGAGMRLCEIVPGVEAGAQAREKATTVVRLKYRDGVIECSREHRSIMIGREGHCGLVVFDAMASRKHCTIELRGDQFVLQDHSTNGTYVTMGTERAVLLRGDDLPLRRYGWIGFSDVRYASSEVVEFSCA
ncbi:MAG TPA: adenylate/guanylate cyclase domain-containing protein [Burkholderiales bacterium]|nr:adenylate/guanylate cyclase domain-containing protein [Burkholderiales bacterium]